MILQHKFYLTEFMGHLNIADKKTTMLMYELKLIEELLNEDERMMCSFKPDKREASEFVLSCISSANTISHHVLTLIPSRQVMIDAGNDGRSFGAINMHLLEDFYTSATNVFTVHF